MAFDTDDTAPENGAALVIQGGVRHIYDTSPALENDPGSIAWPPTLPLELALKLDSTKAICASNGITKEQWDRIRFNPHFVAEYTSAVESLRKEGMAFKARAQLQSLELLKTSWKLIHDVQTPPAVKADMIKATIRFAGLDASRDAALNGSKTGIGFSIQINMG